jgi:hypothetical protein
MTNKQFEHITRLMVDIFLARRHFKDHHHPEGGVHRRRCGCWSENYDKKGNLESYSIMTDFCN